MPGYTKTGFLAATGSSESFAGATGAIVSDDYRKEIYYIDPGHRLHSTSAVIHAESETLKNLHFRLPRYSRPDMRRRRERGLAPPFTRTLLRPIFDMAAICMIAKNAKCWGWPRKRRAFTRTLDWIKNASIFREPTIDRIIKQPTNH